MVCMNHFMLAEGGVLLGRTIAPKSWAIGEFFPTRIYVARRPETFMSEWSGFRPYHCLASNDDWNNILLRV